MKSPIRFSALSLLGAGSMFLGLTAPGGAVADSAQPAVSSAVVTLAAPGLLGGKIKAAAKGEAKGEAKSEEKAPAAAPKPNLELRAGITCIDGFLPQDLQSGNRRDYEVKQGMSTETRGGFVDRAPLAMTNGCFLGELQPNACVAFTVDSKKYSDLGNSNDWELQCVYSDNPGKGMIQNKGAYPYAVDRITGVDMMLLCGHTEGEGYECNEGSNSARGSAWNAKLAEAGKEQLGFCSGSYAYQELDYDHKEYPGGRWVYCQYYNKQSKKNLFGYEFLQSVK